MRSVLLERVLADASDAILVLDASQSILLFNTAAEEMFGFSASEVLGRCLGMLLPERVRSEHLRYFKDFAREPVTRRAMQERGELVGRRKSGAEFPAEVTISKVEVSGQVVFTSIVRDITERRRLEDQLKIESERFRALFQHARDAILVVDELNVARFVTPSYTALLGYGADDRLGRDGFTLVHPDDVEAYRRLFAYVAASPNRSARGRLRAKHRDGEYRWLAVTVTNLLDEPAVAGLVVNARDVTARQEAELALVHLAFHDPLTGLANRALLIEQLTRALDAAPRTGARTAVLFANLDRFKVVNDNLGHRAGDQLLVAVAERLRHCVRPTDTVARVGGDEYVVLVPGAHTIQDAVSAATRVARCLHEPVTIDGDATFTSASIGIVLAEYGDDPERVLANADLAMQEAKDAGRGRYEIYDETLRTRIRDLIDLESDLRIGIDKKQFVPYYQPVIDLADRQMRGVEALVRWRHPSRGLLMPDQFIPMAEEAGLIVGIGQLVLSEASNTIVNRERREDTKLDLAVNVSPRQLDQPDFTQSITSILESTGLDPKRLVVEITESAVINNLHEATRALKKLRDVGIRIAMDDFGTGYSSLSYLSRLPVDIVKIDRSFISAIDDDPANAKVVAAICSLGQAIGLHVIAEGVETIAQHELLRELGCNSAQGYLYGRPRPRI
jgi:diguanylate cyclase (GGDEF)-like protein/PAS domain S-box-containing protein